MLNIPGSSPWVFGALLTYTSLMTMLVSHKTCHFPVLGSFPTLPLQPYFCSLNDPHKVSHKWECFQTPTTHIEARLFIKLFKIKL
jgi:hypothetical protein